MKFLCLGGRSLRIFITVNIVNIGSMGEKKSPKVGANNRTRINCMVTGEEREGREKNGGLASLKS